MASFSLNPFILRSFTPLVFFQRFLEKKPYIRRFGYEDKIHTRGLLPRIKDAPPLNLDDGFKPKNVWNRKRALFGQNDYIDILGNGHLHPVQLLTDIPFWLRGFPRGNELKMLQQRMKHKGEYYKEMEPKKYYDMAKRMRYLYRYLNRKTKTQR